MSLELTRLVSSMVDADFGIIFERVKEHWHFNSSLHVRQDAIAICVRSGKRVTEWLDWLPYNSSTLFYTFGGPIGWNIYNAGEQVFLGRLCKFLFAYVSLLSR